MTFEQRELSLYEGEPIELYEFIYGSTRYLYTSSNQDIVVDPITTYQSIPIRRQKIEQNPDIGKAPITINISRSALLTDVFIESPPTSSIRLIIRRFHRGDSETVIMWIGRIANLKYLEDTVEIRCESIHTSIKRTALRRFYQLSCPHVLYGLDCLVNEASFRITTEVTSASGLNVVSADFSSFADQWFRGGYVSFGTLPTAEYRFITSHIGNTITLNLPITRLNIGDDIMVSPGCDHRIETCINKFNNVDNYGGYPYIPIKNPFGNVQIF